MAGSGFLEELLELLSINKTYPKYQHERRIDLFVNFFLRDILDAASDMHIDFVVPEFPLKKSTSRRSTNADYLAFSAKNKTVFLVEFKTTHRSFKKNQMERYFLAQDDGWPKILEDVEEVFAWTARQDKEKYKKLLNKVRAIPPNVNIEILYIAPEATRSRLDAAASGREYSFLSLERLQSLDIETPFWDEWILVRSSI